MVTMTPPSKAVARSYVTSCGQSTHGPVGHIDHDTFEFPKVPEVPLGFIRLPSPPFSSPAITILPHCQCGPWMPCGHAQ